MDSSLHVAAHGEADLDRFVEALGAALGKGAGP